MTDEPKDEGGLAEDIIPPLAEPPTITRKFKGKSWHRPRKQFIRQRQWNHEIIEQIVKKRQGVTADPVIRVFGLPSSEYLDLLSMRGFCERHKHKVLYLGFNASYIPAEVSRKKPKKPKEVDLYSELQTQRMIDASSFVHTASMLYPDRFELIRDPRSQCRVILNRFSDFDVINLDICGCIIDPNKNRATDVLEAIVELLRWQSIRRLAPWLFYVTTYSSPYGVNREGCKVLIDAIKANADESDDFRSTFTKKAGIGPDDFHTAFTTPEAELPETEKFIRLFACAFGKWLASWLRQPVPPALVSMLPSFCFRHVDEDNPRLHLTEQDPELLSLAYLITPNPHPGPSGVVAKPASASDLGEKYAKQAKQILTKSLAITDLDHLIDQNATLKGEMTTETKELLVGCGFAEADVSSFLTKHQ